MRHFDAASVAITCPAHVTGDRPPHLIDTASCQSGGKVERHLQTVRTEFDYPSPCRVAQRGVSLVKKVEDWIEEQPAPSVIGICQGLGVSQRTLQRAFRAALGIGPSRYLVVLRLAKARRALLAADRDETTVTTIAIDHGFRELGRFAVYYRQMFGERPSETLRRSKSRPD